MFLIILWSKVIKVKATVTTRHKIDCDAWVAIRGRRLIVSNASLTPSNAFWYLHVPMGLFVYLILFLKNGDINSWPLQGWGWPMTLVLFYYVLSLFPYTMVLDTVKINRREQSIHCMNPSTWKKKKKYAYLNFQNISEFLTIVDRIERKKRLIKISYE